MSQLRHRLSRAMLGVLLAGVAWVSVAGPTSAHPTSAHAPRLGTYQCYYYAAYISPTFIGTLILKRDHKYRVKGSPTIGTYAIPRPHRIKLRTGSWAGWRGTYTKSNPGGWVLTIYERDGDYLATCAHD